MGVLVIHDPTREWMKTRGLPCREADPEIFFPAAPGPVLKGPAPPARQKKLDRAKAICKTCPVLNQCRRDTLGEIEGVFGGRDEWQRQLIRTQIPRAYRTKWPASRRRAWQAYVYGLHTYQGLSFKQIKYLTGIPLKLAQEMTETWEAYLAALPPPPEKIRTRQPRIKNPIQPRAGFPEKPGRRDCWVLEGNYAADCWYRGETRDGVWVQVEIQSFRTNIHKWVKRELVRAYNPQPAIYKIYKGRPDAKRSKQVAA